MSVCAKKTQVNLCAKLKYCHPKERKNYIFQVYNVKLIK